jgi:hypothetical protein
MNRLAREIERLSIASDHLPARQTTREGSSVGDPVRHDDFGFGAVASFADGTDARLVVQFSQGGKQTLSLRGAPLYRLGVNGDGAPITGG